MLAFIVTAGKIKCNRELTLHFGEVLQKLTLSGKKMLALKSKKDMPAEYAEKRGKKKEIHNGSALFRVFGGQYS